MKVFDDAASRGEVTQGENQNGKGDFFTELVCRILENCSGRRLGVRPSIEGLAFPKHALDAAYPSTGVVRILVETKVVGTPKTPRNPRQKNPAGRPGSADLDKRVKEAALKAIDLKAQWARVEAKGGGPTSDFQSWLRGAKPHCVFLVAARVVDERDLRQAEKAIDAATRYMDACGLFAYTPAGGAYRSAAVKRSTQMDIVLGDLCTKLRASEA
jgi:hypothetical protein